jgi:hypothetical protein
VTNDLSAADHQPPAGGPGPSFAAPGQPPAAPPSPGAGPSNPSGPPPAYGAQPYGPQPYGPQPDGVQPTPAPGPEGPQDLTWTANGLVASPALPPERVGRGAAFALLAVPAGALVAGVIWKIGFVASISSFIIAALAATLYLRGSGGRVKKGVAVIAAVIALGVVVSFFTVVAVDLYGYFPQLDPDVAATYPTRWSFVRENLFYPPLLKDYTKDAVLFVVFGIIGGLGTILRLVRARATSGRV